MRGSSLGIASCLLHSFVVSTNSKRMPFKELLESAHYYCDHGPAEIFFQFNAFAKDVDGKAQPTLEAQILQWPLGETESDICFELRA